MSRKQKKITQPKHVHVKIKNSHPCKPLTWADIYTSQWFLPLIGVFLLVIVFSLRLIIDIDIGFHLRGGQWMLENMSFHKNDVFTYTVNQNEYIAMYWFYQIILYLVYTFSGYSGLTIMNSILLVLVFSLIFTRMRLSGVPLWFATIAIFLTVCVMEIRFGIRPEVVTWIFLLLTLLILDQYNHNKKNYLFLLPMIQIFWVNFHGLFILGWIVSATYCASTWFHERRLDRTLLTWFMVTVLVSFINPYFFKGVTFPFYLFTRLQSSNIFKHVISELTSPWAIRATEGAPFFPRGALYLYYLLTFVSFAFLLITHRKRKMHDYVLLVAFFYLSCVAIRNVPLFMIIAIHIIALSVHDLITGFTLKARTITKLSARYLPYVFLIIIILLSLRIVTNAYYISDRRFVVFGTGLHPYVHPIGAADFMLKNKLHGRIINDLNSGSWCIWQLPQPVFIDGRLEVMREKFFQEYLESFTHGGLQKLIHTYNPKMILFNSSVALKWNMQLRKMHDWRLIYWDEHSALYACHDYAPSLPAITLIEAAAHKDLDTALSDSSVWNVLTIPRTPHRTHWIEGFFKKQEYPRGLMNMGIFAYQNNEFRVAELFYLEFLKKTEGHLYEVYFNLGSLYYRRGDYEKARYCYERVLHEHPENVLARQRIKEIQRR